MFNSFEAIEKNAFERTSLDLSEKIESIHRAFDSKVAAKEGYYTPDLSKYQNNWSNWLNLENVSDLGNITGEDIDDIKRMYNGTEVDGKKTLGLKDISKYNVHPDYHDTNIKQQSGFSAEVASTAKENAIARREGTGITTYRADDLPDIFPKNDQYVDKVRMDADGNIIERIQSKFVGNDGKSCLNKLASKDFDKYYFDGKVDKMEIPSDYYDEIKNNNYIGDEIGKLERQVERLTANGDLEKAAEKQHQIDRYKKIDEMLERSTVSSDEAIYAREHPRAYVNKLFVPDSLIEAHEAGKISAAMAVGNTIIRGAYSNYKAVQEGTKTREEAYKELDDILLDAGKDALGGYGTGFITSELSTLLTGTGSELLGSMADLGIPGAAVSCITASYKSFEKYEQGQITKEELVNELFENIAATAGTTAGMAMAGSIAGVAFAGATAGALAPAVGSFALGVAGAYVGCAVATKMYSVAVTYGGEGAKIVANKAEGFAKEAVDQVRTVAPEKVESVKTSFNEFFTANSLPIRL